MTLPPPSDPGELRRLAYGVLIAVAVGMAIGRIFSAELLFEPSLHQSPGEVHDPPRRPWPRDCPEPYPTFSSNDRSRWAAVRALVDEGTFVIGRRDPVSGDTGIVFEDGWKTVDKVLHPERLEFYSSKPPLLTVLVAGEYWALKKLFGWSIVEDRWNVIRFILLTINVVPFVVYLMVMVRLVERFGATDWGRLYAIAAACFGTMVTPFLITFNNHTIATTSAALAVYLSLPGRRDSEGWARCALAGFFAGFTACNELPAAALAVGLFAFALWRRPRQALLAFAPAALLPVAALLFANYLQLGEWGFAYAKFGGPWYEYEGSHWRVAPGQVKRGIDWAGRNGESKVTYAFHLLLGHHGVFSLMPIALLALVGMVVGARRCWRTWGKREPLAPLSPSRGRGEQDRDLLAAFALALSVVVIGFYVYKSDNYGGWTNGPRWLMWLTPLGLVTMLPAVDWLGQRRWGRALALVLLALSVLAMSYQLWSPWRHPWLYTFMEARGWVRY